MAKEIAPRPWLGDLCETSGMTQLQISQKAGITTQALWYFISGQRDPGLRVAYALGDILGFDPRRFIEKSTPAA